MSAFRSILRPALILAAVGLAGWGLYRTSPTLLSIVRPKSQGDSAIVRKVETYVVRREDLIIKFVESGKLRAVRSVRIFPGISGRQLRITWLASEGASVKKGDKLVTFDSKEFDEGLQTSVGELESQRQTLVVSQAALDIQISTGKSNLAAAQSKLAEAEVLLRTFRDLEAPKKINELDSEINDRRKKLAEARKATIDAERRLEDQLFTEDEEKKAIEREVLEAKTAVDTLQRILDSFVTQKKIFRQYEYPQQHDAKRQALENARLDLDKAKVSGEKENNQKRAEVAKVQDTINRLERRITDLKSNIEKCTITAPTDGLVIYGDPSSGYYDRPIAVGSEWYAGNALMTIPDLSAFEIDVYIPEEYRGRVTEGASTNITLEAIPNLQITGKLKEISKLGRTRGYYGGDDGGAPKQFKTVISLDSNDPRMVSGMSTRVEIIADSVKNAIVVPVDGVFNDNGTSIVYLREGNDLKKHPVKTGKRNDNFVEITEGLSEGQTLNLLEPADQGNSPTTPAPERKKTEQTEEAQPEAQVNEPDK